MAKITKTSLNKKKTYAIGEKEILYLSPEEFKVYAEIAGFRLYKNKNSGALSCKAYKTTEDYEAEENPLFNFKVIQTLDMTKPVCISLQKGKLEDACLLNKKAVEQDTIASW